MKLVQVAIVGTFDVSNFGDLLFPLIAERELTARFGAMELTRYSYRDMSEETWPYAVRSVSRLPDEVAQYDLLVVGGGHLVRFDKAVASGYQPVDADVHHPTGYWLTPTFLAGISGVPVAWNGLGVSPATPRWARQILGLAVRATDYVSVRDQASLSELLSVAGGQPIRIVPDSVFGVGRILPAEPSERFERFCRDAGISGPYIALQPSPHLLPHAAQIRQALDYAGSQGFAILELPIGPILGDWPGIFSADYPMIRTETWPHPLLLAEIISRASAVIAQSLHLSIVAAASGVPVHRYSSFAGSKHHLIEELRDVYLWKTGADAAEILHGGLGRRPPGHDIAERIAQLHSHWDAIAALVQRPTVKRPALLGALIATCTAAAEHSEEPSKTDPAKLDGLAPLQRQLAGQGEQLAALNARSEQTMALQTELAGLTREMRDLLAYERLVRYIKRAVEATLSPTTTVLVASRGDDELLAFGSRTAWHFPQEEDGTYAGNNPADSDEAIAHLEELHKKGAQFLLLPATAFWWLDHYEALHRYLQRRGRLVLHQHETCMIFALSPGAEDSAAHQ